jgi:hypothetical protein
MCRGGMGSRVLAVSIVGLVENLWGGGAGFWKKWLFWDDVRINTVSFVVTNCLKNLNFIFGIRILVLCCWLVVCYHTYIFVHVCFTHLSSGELTCKGIYKTVVLNIIVLYPVLCYGLSTITALHILKFCIFIYPLPWQGVDGFCCTSESWAFLCCMFGPSQKYDKD